MKQIYEKRQLHFLTFHFIYLVCNQFNVLSTNQFWLTIPTIYRMRWMSSTTSQEQISYKSLFAGVLDTQQVQLQYLDICVSSSHNTFKSTLNFFPIQMWCLVWPLWNLCYLSPPVQSTKGNCIQHPWFVLSLAGEHLKLKRLSQILRFYESLKCNNDLKEVSIQWAILKFCKFNLASFRAFSSLIPFAVQWIWAYSFQSPVVIKPFRRVTGVELICNKN